MTKEEFWAEMREWEPLARRNMSLTKMLKAVGCSNSNWYKWNHGKHAPIRIARIGVIAFLKAVAGEKE